MTDERRRRGRKPAPEKREAIIAAALSTFRSKGVEASTTREIAEAAGTTERTLFKHFGSKERLTRTVFETVSLRFFRERAFARIADATPFTRSSFAAWHRIFLLDRVETALGAPDYYRVIFRELLRDDRFRQDYIASWTEQVYLPLVGHLAQMQTAGEISKKQAATALAGAFYSINIGYLLTRFVLAPDATWDDAKNIDAIVAMFQDACGAP